MSRTTRAAEASDAGGNRRRSKVSEENVDLPVGRKRLRLAVSRPLLEGRRTLRLDGGPGPSQEPRRPVPEKAAPPVTMARVRR